MQSAVSKKITFLDTSGNTLLYIIQHSLKHEKIELAVHSHIEVIGDTNLASAK